MTDTPLCQIARKWGTDKVRHHEYTRVYYDLLKGKTIRRVLEIGIGCAAYMVIPNYITGASLLMWEEFFPEAEIFGFDINPDILLNQGRIRSFFCDQSNADSLQAALAQTGGRFDLVVDDGSHVAEHQVLSAQILAPALTPEGLYIIEDVHVDPAWIMARIPPVFRCDVLTCPSPVLGDEKVVVIRHA